MAVNSSIEWCDSTFNPWIGCTRVSPACDDCYAARSTPARTLGVAWGAGQERRRTGAANWKQPGQWQRQAAEFQAEHGRRRRVFCASLADWLDNEAPVEWLVDLLQLIHDTPDLDWLLLSKRIGNWSSRISEAMGYLDSQGPAATTLRRWLCQWLDGDAAPRNAWLGITVANQAEADRDVPKLMDAPTVVRFLSIEPMLGAIDIRKFVWPVHPWWPAKFNSLEEAVAAGAAVTYKRQALVSSAWAKSMVKWVICGGESGHKARPMHPDWARGLRDQCAAAGVPFLFKQWGEWLPASADQSDPGLPDVPNSRLAWSDGSKWDCHDGQRAGVDLVARVGKKFAGRQLDGRTHDGFPAC